MKSARNLIRFASLTVGLSAAILIAKPLIVGPEVGEIEWPRDFDAAVEASKASGKPVFAFFQEVPGCAGCQNFGQTVLTDPVVKGAIEEAFEPVLIINNRPGKDEEILKRYDEPAWNYQVIRFLDGNGKDLIPRKDEIWTRDALIPRMIEALEKAGRPVPKYLAVERPVAPENRGEVAFAMFCFWTGERKLGPIDGVVSTEAGWLDGREVTKVTWDRSQLDFATLVQMAEAVDCANKVYTTNPADANIAAATRLKTGELDDTYRAANSSDQKKQLEGTPFARLTMSEAQATKVNALVRTDLQGALEWLAPEQRANIRVGS